MLKNKNSPPSLSFLLVLLSVSSSIAINNLASHGTVLDSSSQQGIEYDSITYYIQGHQDDWQLFRGQQAWEDLAGKSSSKTKVVFIYTTAGDAGSKTNGWWNFRERGALASIESALSCTPITIPVEINSHEVTQINCGKTESYFMRIPDGFPNGRGHPNTDYVSLERLYKKEIGNIRTVDDKSTYTDWENFKATLKEILRVSHPEILKSEVPMINIADLNQVYEYPRDHSDHHYTSIAIDEIVKEGGKFNRAMYQTYCLVNAQKNLTDVEIENKKKLFDSYTQACSGSQYSFNLDFSNQEWKDWGEKNNHRYLYV